MYFRSMPKIFIKSDIFNFQSFPLFYQKSDLHNSLTRIVVELKKEYNLLLVAVL